MNEQLILNWNNCVRPDDTVYHLGDVALGQKSALGPILERLNGKIHLILGNHEKPALTYKNRFESVHDLLSINIDRQHIVLCHYAFEVWPYSHKGSWHLHGHSHGALVRRPFRFDIGVDSVARYLADKNNTKILPEYYRPLSFEELKDVFANDTFVSVDHHNQGIN